MSYVGKNLFCETVDSWWHSVVWYVGLFSFSGLEMSNVWDIEINNLPLISANVNSSAFRATSRANTLNVLPPCLYGTLQALLTQSRREGSLGSVTFCCLKSRLWRPGSCNMKCFRWSTSSRKLFSLSKIHVLCDKAAGYSFLGGEIRPF
jgi:hypothetical protein